jgi:hypothetical protein
MNKPILCLDFDGVLHSYTSGWKGGDIVSDPPVPGALEFMIEAEKHFTIKIYSSRSNQPGGIKAMHEWICKHLGYEPDFLDYGMGAFPTEKPSAFLTIDDRAICFTGTFPSIQSLKEFKPWNKQ